jgi:transcriptional regulator with XRE-family HTH domain
MINPAQIRAARGLLGWTQARLAKEAGFKENTGKNVIYRIEVGIVARPHQETLENIQLAFEAYGIEFGSI